MIYCIKSTKKGVDCLLPRFCYLYIRAYRVLFDPGDETTSVDRAEHKSRSDRNEKIESRNEKTRTKSGGKDKSVEATLRFRDRNIFRKHLLFYAGVIVFFALINIFTWHGNVWFHWIALIWGLMQWIVWLCMQKPPTNRR